MFTCRRCKHDDMMHFLFTGYCIERGCDCLSMDGLFDDAWIDEATAARGGGLTSNASSSDHNAVEASVQDGEQA